MPASQYIIEVKLKRDAVPSFEAYPFCLDAVCELESLPLHPAVTFLIGENGSGKSTLLEAIAVAAGFNPEGGSRNFRFTTYASHSVLHEYVRLSRGVRRPRDGYFLRAESFFNVATEIERLDAEPASDPRIIESYGGRSLHGQSHGESFWALLLNRFAGNGLYLLDEPEAALSPTRQMAMAPIIMAYPNAQIFELGARGPVPVAYEDTEHFRVTRDFLNNYRQARSRMRAPLGAGVGRARGRRRVG